MLIEIAIVLKWFEVIFLFVIIWGSLQLRLVFLGEFYPEILREPLQFYGIKKLV